MTSRLLQMTSRPLQMTFGAKTEHFRYFWKKAENAPMVRGDNYEMHFRCFQKKPMMQSGCRNPAPSCYTACSGRTLRLVDMKLVDKCGNIIEGTRNVGVSYPGAVILVSTNFDGGFKTWIFNHKPNLCVITMGTTVMHVEDLNGRTFMCRKHLQAQINNIQSPLNAHSKAERTTIS